MKHLLLLAAIVFASQPVLAHVSSPNGGTLLAVLLVLVWRHMVITPREQ